MKRVTIKTVTYKYAYIPDNEKLDNVSDRVRFCHNMTLDETETTYESKEFPIDKLAKKINGEIGMSFMGDYFCVAQNGNLEASASVGEYVDSFHFHIRLGYTDSDTAYYSEHSNYTIGQAYDIMKDYLDSGYCPFK